MSRRLEKLIEQKAWETLTDYGYNDAHLFEQLTESVLDRLEEQYETPGMKKAREKREREREKARRERDFRKQREAERKKEADERREREKRAREERKRLARERRKEAERKKAEREARRSAPPPPDLLRRPGSVDAVGAGGIAGAVSEAYRAGYRSGLIENSIIPDYVEPESPFDYPTSKEPLKPLPSSPFTIPGDPGFYDPGSEDPRRRDPKFDPQDPNSPYYDPDYDPDAPVGPPPEEPEPENPDPDYDPEYDINGDGRLDDRERRIMKRLKGRERPLGFRNR